MCALLCSRVTTSVGGSIIKWWAVCLSVRLSVYRVPRHNSRTERPRKPKIGMMEAHHTGNPQTYLEIKSSKIKVILAD